MTNPHRTALLAGATGLVGGHCLDLLLSEQSYSKVVVVGRQKLDRADSKLEQHVVDFDRLDDFASVLKGDDVFCCLGTTIKKAGSQENFRRVDFTYTHEIARIASQNGAGQFLLVSALGANRKSSIFYNRVKGEIEEAVSALSFHGVQIFRPSLLLGERPEFRLGERVAEKTARMFSFLFVGPIAKYRPIHARTVANAMVRIAPRYYGGVNIFESARIEELGEGNA